MRGRMVARVFSDYQTLQGYWVDDVDVEQAVRAWVPTKPPPRLSALQVKLVTYSLKELGGAFVIDRLTRAFVGQISRDKLLLLGQEWERKGWLSACVRGGGGEAGG